MAFKIYSIESRKGGVGKTTIALNLAMSLLAKEEPVLLLDCDITGTSISEPALNSPLWNNETNVIKDAEDKPINLLGYFLDQYIKGNSDIPKLLREDCLRRDKINVIGSDVYNIPLSTVVDSRLLMDDLHSYWLKDFIRQLVCQFERLYTDTTVHVIIDNSPGYVGLCQTLHNYMYNLGTDRAKFVMVSSMDAQDLQACMAAAKTICQAFATRYQAGRYFADLSAGGEINKDFEKKMYEDGSLQRFFFKLAEEESLQQAFNKQCPASASYFTLILNKVPRNLSNEDVQVDFEQLVGVDNYDFFKELVQANESGKPQTIVSFDERVSYQFFQKYLKYLPQEQNIDESFWRKRYKRLEQQNKDWQLNEDRIKACKQINLLYENLNKTLIERHYTPIVYSMEREWTPVYGLDNLSDVISSWSELLQRIPVNHLSKEVVTHLHLWNENTLDEMRKQPGWNRNYADLFSLFSFAEETAGFGKSKPSTAYMILVSVFLQASAKLLMAEKAPDQDVREFLFRQRTGYPLGFEWRKYFNDTIYVYKEAIWSSSLYVEFDRQFSEFHRAFCYALLRLMDLHVDFEALVSAIQLYVPSPSSQAIPDEIKMYLNDVIYTKKKLFSKDSLLELNSKIQVMDKIQTTLKEYVIKQWEQ